MASINEDRSLVTKEYGATVLVHLDGTKTARLEIDRMWFSVDDLKQLRKYLKALEKELAQ
jgi:ribosomal protein L19E